MEVLATLKKIGNSSECFHEYLPKPALVLPTEFDYEQSVQPTNLVPRAFSVFKMAASEAS